MGIKVLKFGGSSLADSAQFKKVKDIILADPERRFIVASAPGKRNKGDIKVTDMLYKCYDLAVSGNDPGPALKGIRERFDEIIKELSISFDIDTETDSLKAQLTASPEKEFTASRGEYLNSRVLAAYLDLPFIDAAELIFFKADGRLDSEKTYSTVKKRLTGLPGAVIPGFYGSMPDGRIHTFSRGGSDVSGSIVACGIDASLYENWTDVSGMLSADPRIVDNPAGIDVITYRELRELSYMGASVLHEDAVFPVKWAGIPINIRNTNAPSDSGTMIVPHLSQGDRGNVITGIAGKKGFAEITVTKSLMNGEVGFGAKLLTIFADEGVPFEHCPTGIDTMSVVVNEEKFNSAEEMILARIRDELKPDEIEIERGFAMVAVVGQRMASTVGTACRVTGALKDAGVNIRMIDQGSSELNIILGVEEADYEKTVRAIYKEFFC